MVGVGECDGGRGSNGGKMSDGGGGAMKLTHLGSSSPVSVLGCWPSFMHVRWWRGCLRSCTHGCKTMPCTLDPSTYAYCVEDAYDHALWDMDWSRVPPQYNSGVFLIIH